MTTVIRRKTIRLVEEIFNNLGSTFQQIKIYSESHPRFQESCRRISGMIEESLERKEFKKLTFTLQGTQVAFLGLPLFNVGQSGKKLIQAMSTAGLGGLQIHPGIEAHGVAAIVKHISSHCRKSAKAPVSCLPEGSEDDHFLLLSEDVVNKGTASPEQKYKFSEDLKVPELWVSENNFRSVLTTYRNLLSDLEGGRILDYSSLIEASDRAIALFSENPNRALEAATKTYFDDFTFHHSINVCLLATTVAARLVDDMKTLKLICLAALLHDLGKSQIPAEILYKEEKLTEAEYECLKEHPVIGAEMLLGVDGIHPLCVAVAFGHHIHEGPSSYPRTRKHYRCDPVTELIAVVDIYEALTAVRPYKQGFSSRKAFDIMLRMSILQKRLPLVRLLYECLGPYPEGTLVELNTGERAKVISKNDQFPHLPRIRILTAPDRTPLTEPLEVDLAETWKKGLSDGRTISKPIVIRDPADDPLQVEVGHESEVILGRPAAETLALMFQEG